MRLSLANGLSISRVPLGLAVAGCVLVGWWPGAAVAFAVAVFTDLVDGPLARRNGRASVAGGLVDHGSDAACVVTMLASFAWVGDVPWLLPPLIAAAFAQYVLDSGAHGGRALSASFLGRWNGIGYFVLAGALVFASWAAPGLLPALHVLAWMLTASTAASMLDRWLARRRVRAR